MIKLGNKDYLPVAARLQWLNIESKSFTIDTELIEMSDKHAIFKATVTITGPHDSRKASSFKREDRNHFPDFVEKACTGAVGRALGMLGFGTQFTNEFDEVSNEDDTVMEKNGVQLLIDPMSYQYLVGAEIDYSEGLEGAQFVIKNPGAKSTCGCGSSFST